MFRKVINRLPRTKFALLPKDMFVVINSKCNAKCKMCDIGTKNKESQFSKVMDKGTEWSVGDFEEFIRDTKRYIERYHITSTEPLLHKNIIELIQKVKENGRACTITTNGILLPKYADELCEVEVDKISVSIDGLPKIHDEMRGTEGIFANAWKGIFALKRNDNPPPIEIDTMITPINQSSLADFALMAQSMADYHIINHMNFITKEMAEKTKLKCTESSVNKINPHEVNPAVLYTELLKVKRFSPRVAISPNLKTIPEIELYYKTNTFLPKHNLCKAIWNVGQVLANGDVGVSTRCYDIVFGNVKAESFSEIWNGTKMQKFREYLIKERPLACARCCGVF
jgi:MoaA/NifB/PqqE/SkfB family radical SAM enzyme